MAQRGALQIKKQLADGLACDLRLKQCSDGYYRLRVVPKRLYQGERGGLFYINQRGNLVYLNDGQKRRMMARQLPGLQNPEQIPDFYYGQIPQPIFERIERQLNQAHQFGIILFHSFYYIIIIINFLAK